MLDSAIRRAGAPLLEGAGRRLAALGVRAAWLTAAGWVAGVGACVAAGTGRWGLALALWLVNRALDGLDGPVARASAATDRGAFLDVVADFSVYGGFVVAVAFAEADARLACALLLGTYYASGTAFLALSSLRERAGCAHADARGLGFVGGLAEGAETVVAYVAFCLLPADAAVIAWCFAALVAVTALQRVVLGARLLGPGAALAGEDPGVAARWPSP